MVLSIVVPQPASMLESDMATVGDVIVNPSYTADRGVLPAETGIVEMFVLQRLSEPDGVRTGQ